MTETIRSAAFGGGGGMRFDDAHDVDDWGRIARIIVRHGEYVDAIQLVWANGNVARHGGPGGVEVVIDLQADEVITMVKGRSGQRLDQITLVSNLRTFGPFGGGGGDPFQVDFGGHVLHDLFGQSGMGIDRIGFGFGPRPSTPPARPPLTLFEQLAARFCPVVYFHDCERNLPCSIEFLVRNSTLNASGASTPIPDIDTFVSTLTANSENALLTINPSQYPGEPVGPAPIYYAVQEFEDCIEITYALLFAYQGGQTLRALRPGGAFLCYVYDYGKHQGDIEELTVRLVARDGGYHLERVGYEAHGDVHWFVMGEFDLEGSHPVAHSALNGHSMHNVKKEGTWVVEDTIPEVAEFGSALSSGNAWRPYQHSTGLRRIGLDPLGQPIGGEKWAAFAGRIGALEQNPFRGACAFDGSGLSATEWAFIDTGAKIGSLTGLIMDKYRHGIGPSGPATRPYIKAPTERFRFAGAQPLWRWCNNCHMLFYCGSDRNSMPSVCVAGNRHDPSGSSNYILNIGLAPAGGEWDWRWCCKCGVLYYGHGPSRCPKTGGAHDPTGSGSCVLYHGEEVWHLNADQPLTTGSILRSPNKHFLMEVGEDGDFGVHNAQETIWRAGTGGKARGSYALVMQRDGNLVLYGPGGVAWDSGTGGRPPAENRLALLDNGEFVAYDPAGGVIWASGQNRVDNHGQSGWRLCCKCGGVSIGGPAMCPAGGGHDYTGSKCYGIMFTPDRA